MEKIFIESIKVENGDVFNLELHTERSSATIFDHFGVKKEIPFLKILSDYPNKKGLFKFRVLYSDSVIEHSLTPYNLKDKLTVLPIECDNLEYRYKYANREVFDNLVQKRGICDDVLIIKNGFVTDTSYGNILFRLRGDNNLYTPDMPLLKGTKREFLLRKGLIKQRSVKFEELKDCEMVYMINAMIDYLPLEIKL